MGSLGRTVLILDPAEKDMSSHYLERDLGGGKEGSRGTELASVF